MLLLRRLPLLLVAALAAAGAPAHAALQLRLDRSDLTGREQEATQHLLDETFAMLPPLMVERLDQDISVRWSSRLPDSVIGRAGINHSLLLNRRWLPVLTENGEQPALPGRQHPSLRRELAATLIHELTHFYDRGHFRSPEQQRLQRYCRTRHRVQGAVGAPGECRNQTMRRYTLSDDPRLLDLAGWPQQVGRRGQREAHNHQQLRSPDRYEFRDPQEFTAVNLEYFLLDAEYSCRRPALARYFQDHFQWAPPATAACTAQLPFLNARLQTDQSMLGWLDPQRIYQVHYLLAEPDANLAGRWGHSMLRLVICAPQRSPGPECMLDLQHHLVLSYRAFVDDVQLSSWDGLTGIYPSRLFILPLHQVIEEYTRTELRSLSSVPLQLDRHQIERLAVQAATQHWSYDGRYYFVTNNCAVETLKLLRSGTGHPQLHDLDSHTPLGLLQALQSRKLADLEPLRDRDAAMSSGFYFDSYRQRYDSLFAVLKQHLALPQQQASEWFELSAQQRRQWYDQADLQTSAALLLLEQAAQRRQLQQLRQALKQRYLQQGDTDADLSEAGQLMRNLLTEGGFLSRPADLLDRGYGLPQIADHARLDQLVAQRQDHLLAMSYALDARIASLLPTEEHQALEETEHNIRRLREQLRQLQRAAGGVRFQP